MPNNNFLFNNYKDKCSKCGGALNADHIFCPYCGEDLKSYNEKYEDKEEQIRIAITEVQNAKKRIEVAEKNLKKKSKNNIVKIVGILAVVFIVLPLLVAFIGGIIEGIEEGKIEALKQNLLDQEVNYLYIEKLSDDELIDFVNMSQTPAGYIKENEKFLFVPLYSSSHGNDMIIKTKVYLDKNMLGPIDSISFDDAEYGSIYMKNGSIHLDTYYNSYVTSTLDCLHLYDGDAKITRLDDIVIDNYVFECYLDSSYSSWDKYYFICNPYPNFYFEFSVSCYNHNDSDLKFSLKEIFFIKDIEFIVESK